MSYLQLAEGLPDFAKLVVSLWFRVPQTSIDAAAAARTGNDGAMFDGIIPLVVMGNKGKDDIPTQVSKESVLAGETSGYTPSGLGSVFNYEVLGPCDEYGPYSSRVEGTKMVNEGASWVPIGPYQRYADQYTEASTGPAPDSNPSFIGLDCSGGSVSLFVNLETTLMPVVSGYAFNEAISPGTSQSVPSGTSFPQGTVVSQWCSQPFGLLIEAIPGSEEEISNSIADVPGPAGTSTGEPHISYTDISSMELSATGAIYSNLIEITPDRWHHLLLSVELQTIETHGGEWTGSIADFVDSAARLFVAVDDVNYTGWDLTDNWPEGDDPNATLTDEAWRVAGTRPATDQHGDVMATAHYTLASPKVLNGGEPVGLPATALFVDKILPLEMAELQIFAGVSIDTGVMANRRAFIDGSGYPVSPLTSTDDPGPAEKLLGKKPEVLLHGSGNWIKGSNTGEPARDELIPTGKIIAYSPDPSLNGPQGGAV